MPEHIKKQLLKEIAILEHELAHELPAEIKKAVALGPNQQMAVGNLADSYRAAGQKDLASTTYDQAIALAFKDLQVNPQYTECESDVSKPAP